MWWERSDQSVRLLHRVSLVGAKAPKNYFYLAINPGESPLCWKDLQLQYRLEKVEVNLLIFRNLHACFYLSHLEKPVVLLNCKYVGRLVTGYNAGGGGGGGGGATRLSIAADCLPQF